MTEKVALTALTCKNCGASLTIIAPHTAECDYCSSVYVVSNMDDIIFEEQEEAWSEGMPYSPYFYQPSRSCRNCTHWTEGVRWHRCSYHGKVTDPDMVCDHFREFEGYWVK